ncbi:MAG: PIG-L family deacetylase [Bacteroidetes bacterium]|nr:PIG-L family deacetylase [Bacteroidota bacterium]
MAEFLTGRGGRRNITFSASLPIIVIFSLFFSSSLSAGTFRKTPGKPGVVLMCLSAHPDDEDGATIAYYTHIRHIKTYEIFYTRGEGGQNVIGPELYNELGEIRSEETLTAAKILGGRVYFLGFLDFGYSKTAKETFRMWGGNDNVLQRIVYMIRALKPDVIITNHDTITTLPYRQHGNHQVVGITAYEAFTKAADPTYHPEQFGNGIRPWQVKKLYFRILRKSELHQDSLVTIPVEMKSGEKTIQQIAWDALKQHRTQGMDRLNFHKLPEVFRQPIYGLILSDKKYPYNPHDLFTGIRPSVRPRVTLPEKYAVALKPFSIFIHPKYSLLKAKGDSVNKFRFSIDTYNHTDGPLYIGVFVNHGSERVFDEHEELSSAIRDSIRLSVDVSSSSVAEDSLVFNCVPLSAAKMPGLSRSTDVAYLRRVTAKFDKDDYIGLVSTYDNTLERTFDEFGVRYQSLDSSTLASGDLNKFTTVVLDIRGYLYRHDLVKYNQRILDYIRNGGNVVCFYNRPPEWDGHSFAPYPIDITEHRVTEETQPVTVSEPENPLFHYPNEILPVDWNRWVQERNIYLPSGDTALTSSKYQRLLAMSDEDQHEPSTSLLWAKYGRGAYIYTSLALYRQVKDLNNGGVKLLFNLISQPRH